MQENAIIVLHERVVVLTLDKARLQIELEQATYDAKQRLGWWNDEQEKTEKLEKELIELKVRMSTDGAHDEGLRKIGVDSSCQD